MNEEIWMKRMNEITYGRFRAGLASLFTFDDPRISEGELTFEEHFPREAFFGGTVSLGGFVEGFRETVGDRMRGCGSLAHLPSAVHQHMYVVVSNAAAKLIFCLVLTSPLSPPDDNHWKRERERERLT